MATEIASFQKGTSFKADNMVATSNILTCPKLDELTWFIKEHYPKFPFLNYARADCPAFVYRTDVTPNGSKYGTCKVLSQPCRVLRRKVTVATRDQRYNVSLDLNDESGGI